MDILYVENHAGFAKSVIQMFLHEHKVTVCPTVVEAIVHLKQSDWDVVIVDYDLDDGKGDQVAQFAKDLQPKPRIIAASSHERGNRAILDAGADAICSKMKFRDIANFLGNDSD